MKHVWLPLMGLAMLLIAPVQVHSQEGENKLTLEDIWASGKLRGESIRGGRSMNDGEHYTVVEEDRGGLALNKYSYATGKKVETLVMASDLIPPGEGKPIRLSQYSFSKDESQLLISTEIELIYRYSTRAFNYVYNLETKKLVPLYDGGKQRYATFSPNGKRVAFVHENNMYFTDLATMETTKMSQDGRDGAVINGATDWVYEEEFAFSKAFFWSPDSRRIAFYSFEEANVREFNMPLYGSLYPKDNTFKYPKAGEANSQVSLRMYNVETKEIGEINLPGNDEYIPRVKWTKQPFLLGVFTMNRLQNNLQLLLVDANDETTAPAYFEASTTYIDITDDWTFLNEPATFIYTSEKDGYKHIYWRDAKTNKDRQITKGEWDVDNIVGVDETRGLIYYMSSERSPLDRDLYSIKLDGSEKVRLSDKAGTNRVKFSKGYKYYINYHTDANSPTYISLHKANGKEIRVLKDNDALRKKLKEYDLSKKEFYKFTAHDTIELNGWMIKPPDFDKNKQYPVLMHVYGGPGSQTVRNSWGGNNFLWHQYMAQQGYIVVSVDNRGTGARGREFKNCTYKQLGKYETEDQMAAAEYLGGLKFVDKERIGIWGWSYGGYMSSLCLTKGASLFKAAVAVAPVTNWRFYDTIYTERYMQTPQKNGDGYDDNSPINHVEKMEGAYLLVHGTADDNVHFQNSIEMVDALIKANKQFDFYMYPGKNHGIYGGNTRFHLFTKISSFLTENL